MADEKDVELQRLRRRVKELEAATKTCNDCKFCKSCIMSAPDGEWSACEHFEGKKMDLIDRELVIEWINNWRDKNKYYHPLSKNKTIPISEVIDILEGAPSAEKTGRWIEQDDEYNDTIYQCSVCGEEFVTIEGTPADNLWNYCPCCGARMEVHND